MDANLSGAGSPGKAQRTADEAAQWLSRRDRGLTAAEAGEFQQWMNDPERADEFERTEVAWDRFDRVKADPELAAMARRLEARTRLAPRRTVASYWGWALASAAALAVVVALRSARFAVPTVAPSISKPSYRIVPSAAHQLTLSDGSVVELRADSEVSTDFTPEIRHLQLVQGEAHFKVTKNPARPFVVRVGSLAVRAVGTAFDILQDGGRVEVVVTEGKVTVEDLAGTEAPPAVPLLLAGQRAVISREGGPGAAPRVVIDSLTRADVEQVLAWQDTWLEFDRTTLDEAVKAFNARSSTRIILGDAALSNRRIGGRFRADNVEGFVRLLEQSVDVRSERRGENEIVLLPAHQ